MTLVAPPPIPRAAGSLPLLGHAIQLLRDNLAFTTSLRRRYGPLVEITLQPGTRTLVVQEPALIRTMLTDLAPTLDKGRLFDKMGQLLGESVITVAGQEHVRKRRQLQPALGRAEIAGYVDVMRGQATEAVDSWQPGQRIEVRETMVKLSLDMLTQTIFSGSLDADTFRRLQQNIVVVMDGVGVRLILPDWVERLPLPYNRRFMRARDAVHATVSKAVTDLRATGHNTGDMLSMLMEAKDENTGLPLTDQQICSEILTLAVAGTETTATVLAWAMYELARNPDIEARVLAELHEVLGDRPITFDDITGLPYLNRVVTEVLRLHHMGWIVTRRTLTETRLGEWTLPADTELAYCQHALHRDPEYYPEPLKFDPDRWLDDKQKPPPGGFLPFGAGKHKCMGDRFAMTELTTSLATILRRVRLELAPGQVVRPVGRATARPGKMLMTVRERGEFAAD
ncbi:cytochrome P450 [Streptomyces sp. NPDC001351]|uniref:cytochrome P450 n=1 Tax=Streptomyces sp. NPDC001351 TaxID=3364564 RepID=UPI0036A2FA61